MPILRDISILWSLCHILVIFVLLYRPRYSEKKSLILTVIFMGPLALLQVVGVIFFGPEFMGRIFLVTCTLPSFFFFWYMSADRKGQFFFTFCLADTVSYWVLLLTNLVDFYFGGQRYILMFIGRLILFPLMEWVAVRYLKKPYRELQESSARGWGLFAAMTVCYYLLLASIANYPVSITKRPQEMVSFLIIMALMPMTYATIFAAMYRQHLFFCKQQSERMILEQKNTLETRLEDQQLLQKMKHDIKGYVATLSGLLAEDKTKEALTYLKAVEEEADPLLAPFCSNPYINAVFVHYAGKFEKMGAEFQPDIQIGDEKLPYIELCRILTNGLENACDALKEFAAGERKVSVHMKYNREYLLMRIRNRCREDLHVEKGTIPATDKKDAGHGFGLVTIKEAAEKLNGDMYCYTENGTFVLDVLVSTDTFDKE